MGARVADAVGQGGVHQEPGVRQGVLQESGRDVPDPVGEATRGDLDLLLLSSPQRHEQRLCLIDSIKPRLPRRFARRVVQIELHILFRIGPRSDVNRPSAALLTSTIWWMSLSCPLTFDPRRR